jgi:hypothetical protein
MSAGLIAALRERGLIAPDAPAPPEAVDATDRPWFLSLLMGIAGWIAGLFVLLFFAILLDLDKRLEAMGAGVVLLAIAWGLYAIGRGKVFLDQLALAFSIAGQLGITVFLVEKLDDALPVTAAILGMQLLLFAVMPDRVAKTLATFFASIAWVFVVRFYLRPNEGGGEFFGPQGDVAAPLFGVWTVPLEWAITWAPAIVCVLWLRRTETRWMAHRAASYARPAITGLLLGVALGGMAAEPVSLLALGVDEMGREFDWWSLFPLLSIGLALFAAFNAFALRSAGLLGVAIFAALAHLARFYYLYGTTLTVKAAIMLGVGLLLLGAGRLLARRMKSPA